MLLVEFYKGAPDLVRFQEPWSQEHTYLDKLKVSLMPPVSCKPLEEDRSWGAPRDLSMGSLRNRCGPTLFCMKYCSWILRLPKRSLVWPQDGNAVRVVSRKPGFIFKGGGPLVHLLKCR